MKSLLLSVSVFALILFQGYGQTQSDCSKFDNIMITSTPACAGASNGTITVIIPKGTKSSERPSALVLQPKNKSTLLPGDTTVYGNLEPGPYAVTIQDGFLDDNGHLCTRVQKINVVSQAPFPLALLTSNAGYDENCDPIDNGEIYSGIIYAGKRLFPVEFKENVSFKWSNGATTPNITSLAEGKYNVTVTTQINGLQCSKVDSAEITRNGKIEKGGSNFNDPEEETNIDQDFNVKIGMGTNGTNAILTENTSLASFQFDFNTNVDAFLTMCATFYNHGNEDIIAIIYHRDADREILQRFDNEIIPPKSNRRICFTFNETGGGSDIIQFLIETKSGSGPINGEVDDIELINPVFDPNALLGTVPQVFQISESQIIERPDGNLRTATPEPTYYQICSPDTIPLFTGFRVQGGTTPYNYSWDLNGDQIFGDAFGDSILLIDPDPGIHDIGLVVSDAGFQTDTTNIRIEITESVQYQIDFPTLDSIPVDDAIVYCIGDGLLKLATIPPGGIITGSGVVNDSFFDPQLAGPGGHVLMASGNNFCDQSGLAAINIQPESNPSWNAFSIRSCDPPIRLNNQVTGDTIGSWYVNGSYVPDGIFNPSDYEEDSVLISYALGRIPCNVYEAKTIAILPPAEPALTVNELSVDACEGSFSLNALISGDTSGSWNGGPYINNDRMDPSGLESGSYEAVYSIGTDNCLRTDTIQFEVTACTNASHRLSERVSIDISPNPGAHEAIGIILEGNQYVSLDATITTIQGDFIKRFNQFFIGEPGYQRIWLEVGPIPSGVYFLQIQDQEGNQLSKRWIHSR